MLKLCDELTGATDEAPWWSGSEAGWDVPPEAENLIPVSREVWSGPSNRSLFLALRAYNALL